MNVLDVIVMGGAYINIYIIPFMLFAGFISAWPYNYWRLKKYKLSCHWSKQDKKLMTNIPDIIVKKKIIS